MNFDGFADSSGAFFGKLAKNQNREWFLAHKEAFENGWNLPMKALLQDVFPLIDNAFPHCDLDVPKVFRIYRDVRFAKDKAPYKTNIGGHISIKRTGKATEVPIALYFHVGHNECFAAAGHYMMDGATLTRFRNAVADEVKGKALEKIIKKLESKGFVLDSHETSKRVPKGFEPDHPRANLLKRKGLTATFPGVPKALLTDAKLPKHIAAQVKLTVPLVEWLVYATA
jgi:uncharacterized protein (TIGR02453 family)